MILPVLIMLIMMGCAAVLSTFSGVTGSSVFLPYLAAWASLALISSLVWAFVDVAKMAKANVDQPLSLLPKHMMEQQRLFLLPALIFPLFIGGYTWAKCSIPYVVGYGWERIWADADAALFGTDGWRILHAVFPPWLAPWWTYFYAVVWGLALGIVGSLVSAFASHRFTATFFTALMLSWFIGGFVAAYSVSAAGPVFAHLVDPSLAARFEPLRARLIDLLGPDDIVMRSQGYLAAGMKLKFAIKGGGVSAMPSMHIATSTIFVLAAWKSRWLVPAIVFLLLTFLGSIYLGYHYAVDAPVAAIIAVICWFAAGRIYRERGGGAAVEKSLNLKEQPVAQ